MGIGSEAVLERTNKRNLGTTQSYRPARHQKADGKALRWLCRRVCAERGYMDLNEDTWSYTQSVWRESMVFVSAE